MINFIDWLNIKINEEATATAPAADASSNSTSSTATATSATSATSETPDSAPSDDSKPKDQNGTMSSDIAKVPYRLGCCGFGCYSFKNYVKRKKKRKKKK